jgi:site-specific DNA-cytosine methylase
MSWTSFPASAECPLGLSEPACKLSASVRSTNEQEGFSKNTGRLSKSTKILPSAGSSEARPTSLSEVSPAKMSVTPTLCGENAPALLGRGLGEVLGDLAEIGYDAEWHCVRACDIGFPHERDRIWIIAYPIGSRGQRLVTSKDFSPNGPRRWGGTEDLQLVSGTPFERGDRWPQPLIRRVDDGLPGRLDRLHGVGNAVVPAIAEIIGRAIMTALASQQLGQGE